MLQQQVGDITIHRILESERPDFDAAGFFPQITPEQWAPYRQRLAREYKIKFLRPNMFVKSQPSQSLLSRYARRNLKRNVSLKVIAGFIEVGVRIKHDGPTAIRGVENIKIAIGIGLDQKANVISFAKLV